MARDGHDGSRPFRLVLTPTEAAEWQLPAVSTELPWPQSAVRARWGMHVLCRHILAVHHARVVCGKARLEAHPLVEEGKGLADIELELAEVEDKLAPVLHVE